MTLLFDISSITPTTGGGGANLTTLDITPSTVAQNITPDEGYDGFNVVNVSAVNASIDANITASNIKQGVDILGVTGTMLPSSAHSVSSNYSVVNGEAIPFNKDLTGAFDGITSVAANAMKNAFDSCTVNTPIVFPDLEQIGNNGMNKTFAYCYNLPSANFPNLMTIENNGMNGVFTYCNNLTSVSFDKLTNIGNMAFRNAFNNSTNLASVSFSSLRDIPNYCFFYWTFYNTKISEFNFPSVVNVGVKGFAAESYPRYPYLTSVNFCNVTSVGENAFYHAFRCTSNFTGDADFSSLSTVTNTGAFQEVFTASGITSANFASLTDISATNAFTSAFSSCYNLAYVNFDNLRSVFGFGQGAFYRTFTGAGITTASFPNLANVSNMHYCFSECSNVTNVYMPNLYNIALNGMNWAFWNCTNITNITFNSLYNIYYGGLTNAFNGCTSLTELRFPALGQAWNNSFDGMLAGCTGVTVHFPAAMESTMSGWSSVTGGFGGTNTTVLFDLNSGGSPAPGR